jgi:hypothetical protein
MWLAPLQILLSGQHTILENVYAAIVSCLAFLALMGQLIYGDGWAIFKLLASQEVSHSTIVEPKVYLTPTRRLDNENPPLKRRILVKEDETVHRYTESRIQDVKQDTTGNYWVECPRCRKRVYNDSIPSLRFVRCNSCEHLIPLAT